MKLSELAERIPGSRLVGAGDVDLCRAVHDSRGVQPGDLFVAMSGTKVDGHRFVQAAIDAGARAAVVERPVELAAQPPLLVVRDPHEALGLAAHALAGDPTRRLTVCGITGTSGKTTTSILVRSILHAWGRPSGLLGTITYELGRRTVSSNMTTPDSSELAAYFAEMVESGLRAAVMEVSSHALHQRRTAGIRFAAAAFTNLTPEHMDYHPTIEHYRDAKGLLFEGLERDAWAILNADDPQGEHYAKHTPAHVLTYGLDHKADVTAENLAVDLRGCRFTLVTPRGRMKVHSPLLGRHNACNSLTAAAMGEALGVPLETIAEGLASVKTVRGRLETVPSDKPFTVLVDYAHKTDALQHALSAIADLMNADGRLIVVFGCGGDRDRQKRPQMAKVAEQLADRVIVTSDNPRSEKPEAIIDEILTGFTSRGSVIVEVDRRAAIEMALREARPGDVVVIAGKGHETYQILGGVKRDFDDRAVAAEILSQI